MKENESRKEIVEEKKNEREKKDLKLINYFYILFYFIFSLI